MTKEEFEEIKDRYRKATILPYKTFPIVMLEKPWDGGPSEQTKLMNEFLQLGLDASHDVPKLVGRINELKEALEYCKNTLESILDYDMEMKAGIGKAQEALKA